MRAVSLVLFLSLLVPSAFAGRGNPDVSFDGQSVDQLIAAFVRVYDVPGISLAIVQAPYITRATGFGLADPQRKTLVSVNTMFNIAQMRNAFTAVAAMQLVEEGKLELAAVLPLIRQSRSADLESLIANASGRSYEQYIRERQFERLGLRHTSFASELAGRSREPIDPTEPAAGGVPAAHAIYSSASDISIWDIALAGDLLIRDPALRKLLYEPPADAPSSGPWFFPGHPGLMIATGDGEGFSSLLARFTHRDELICVTLLANKQGLDLTQLARKIAGAFDRRTGPPAQAAGRSAQQSPFSLTESTKRLERALRARGIESKTVAWEEEGAVWIALEGDADADAALLEAIGAIAPQGQ